MNLPLISVILPNYNHAIFLDERIQSILNQTYKNFELIIMDDKSTDNSVEVIHKYKNNPHVSCIIVNTHNSGSSFAQWYKGFELAKGEIVWIAESDDSCDKRLLETLVNGYVKNQAVLAFCRSCRYDVKGNKSRYNLQESLKSDIVSSGSNFISQYMIDRNVVANASSAIFNRKNAMAINKQYMTMRGEGDYLFWLELIEHGNVFFCNQELNNFRFHELNTTKSLSYSGKSQIEHKIIYDYLVQKGYVSGFRVWKEKIRCLRYFSEMDYDSQHSKRRVLRIWDKYGVGRMYIYVIKIISPIKQIRNLWKRLKHFIIQ